MFKTTLKRIVRAGLISFYRNRFVSLGTIFVMVITLSLMTSVLFARSAINSTLFQMKQKVDVNVYFVSTATEDKILALSDALKALPEVKDVGYTSKEKALENFSERHKGDQLTLQALKELDDNPFGAVLSIKARDTNKYATIVHFLEEGSPYVQQNPGLISKINYKNNKAIIDKLNIMIDGISLWGKILTFLFVAISVMITFVTIRLAIYIFREEISVMRLVGADNLYIRGPFIVEGVAYGLTAAVFTHILFWPLSVWATAHTYTYLAGVSFFDFYLRHFFSLFGLLVIAGSLVGGLSSFMAVRRYLR